MICLAMLKRRNFWVGYDGKFILFLWIIIIFYANILGNWSAKEHQESAQVGCIQNKTSQWAFKKIENTQFQQFLPHHKGTQD